MIDQTLDSPAELRDQMRQEIRRLREENELLKVENESLKARADIVAAMLRKSLVYLTLDVAISKTYEQERLNG